MFFHIACKQLWLELSADGGRERDVVHRTNQGYKAWGALKNC